MRTSENFSGENTTETLPYLLFAIGKNIYGINSEHVRGIETLGKINSSVDPDPNVRGSVFYQGCFVPLLDMRMLFGLDTQIEEFENMVQPDQRIRDHENWVSTLERCVNEHIEFTLTDDPHKCAFGRWFYSFETDNNVLKHELGTIEGPHAAIHNTAKTIKKLMNEDNYDKALDVIKEMRNTHYTKTIKILSSLRDVVKESLRELYIVIDTEKGLKGMIVDSVVGIEELELFPIYDMLSGSGYVEFFGKREKDASTVLVLNNSI